MSKFGNHELDVDADAIARGRGGGGDADAWADKERDMYDILLYQWLGSLCFSVHHLLL